MPDQSEQTKIAVLETQFKNLNDKVDHLQDGIDMINTKLDDRYPTKSELESVKQNFEAELAAVKEDLNFWKNILIAGILVGILLGVLALLFK